MKLPASQTDIRKPGKSSNAIEFKNSTAPRIPNEIVKPKTAPRLKTRPVIKPITKSVYVPEPTRQEIVMGDWMNTVNHFGNQDDAIKDFIQRYFAK
jgi:hypothetical protein